MEYTVAFIFSEDLSKVLLVKKERPAWQKGFLNGIGGKIENGESSLECIKREVNEEAGLIIKNFEYVGQINGSEYSVDVFTSRLPYDEIMKGKTLTDEKIGVYNLYSLDQYELLASVR